jgi:hypothetical protein
LREINRFFEKLSFNSHYFKFFVLMIEEFIHH